MEHEEPAFPDTIQSGTEYRIDGVKFWRGGSRIMVCDNENIFRQTSFLMTEVPRGTSLEQMIRSKGEEIRRRAQATLSLQ